MKNLRMTIVLLAMAVWGFTNLAHDVATGNKSVDEARDHYTEAIMAVMNDETPEYTQELMFESMEDAGFTDEPTIPEDKLDQMQ